MRRSRFILSMLTAPIATVLRKFRKEPKLGTTYIEFNPKKKRYDKDYYVHPVDKRVWIPIEQLDGLPLVTLQPEIFDTLKKEGCNMGSFVRDLEDPNIIYPSTT